MKKTIIGILLCMMLCVSSAFALVSIPVTNLNGQGRSTILNYANVNSTNSSTYNLRILNAPVECSGDNYFMTRFTGNSSTCSQINQSTLSPNTGGGWTNTTSATSTTKNVGIGMTPSTPLAVYGTSTGHSINFVWNLTSAFIGAIKVQKYGNSTSSSGNPASGDELFVLQGDVANGTGTLVRRSALTFIADGNHDGSTTSGTRLLVKVTDRNTNNYVTSAVFTGTGVSITNSSSAGLQPSDRLFVDGSANISQVMKFGLYAYPPCTTSTDGWTTYNFTSKKHVGCNSTAWNNLY